MNTERVLTLIGEYLSKANKRSATYKTLLALQEDVKKLVEDEPKPNSDTAYHCSICGKISVRLMNKKYCLDCYDKFID